MAVVTDSTITPWHQGYDGSLSTVSGSVSLPANSLVLVTVIIGTDYGTNAISTPTNSGTSLTWTAIGTATCTSNYFYSKTFYAKNTSAQSVTITAAGTYSGAGSFFGLGAIGQVLTGHDLTTPVQTTIGGPGQTSANPFTTPTLSCSSAGRMYAVFSDTMHSALPTSSDAEAVVGDANIVDTAYLYKTVTATTNALNIDAAGSGATDGGWITFLVNAAATSGFTGGSTPSFGQTVSTAANLGLSGTTTATFGNTYATTAAFGYGGTASPTFGQTVSTAAVLGKVGDATPTFTTDVQATGRTGVVGDADLTTGLSVTTAGHLGLTGSASLTTGLSVSAAGGGTILGTASFTSGLSVTTAGRLGKVGDATLTTGLSVTTASDITMSGTAVVTSGLQVTAIGVREGDLAGPLMVTFHTAPGYTRHYEFGRNRYWNYAPVVPIGMDILLYRGTGVPVGDFYRDVYTPTYGVPEEDQYDPYYLSLYTDSVQTSEGRVVDVLTPTDVMIAGADDWLPARQTTVEAGSWQASLLEAAGYTLTPVEE